MVVVQRIFRFIITKTDDISVFGYGPIWKHAKDGVSSLLGLRIHKRLNGTIFMRVFCAYCYCCWYKGKMTFFKMKIFEYVLLYQADRQPSIQWQ